MGDQDWLDIDPNLLFEQSADLYHLQLYSFERYIVYHYFWADSIYSSRNISWFYQETSNFHPRARLQGWSRRWIQVWQFQERRPCSFEPRLVCPLCVILVVRSWLNPNSYVRTHTRVTLTIRKALIKINVAHIEIEFKPNEFGDYSSVALEGWGSFWAMLFMLSVLLDPNHSVIVNFNCGRSKSVGLWFHSNVRKPLNSPIVGRCHSYSWLSALHLPHIKASHILETPSAGRWGYWGLTFRNIVHSQFT